jgi:hypothetical protein
MVMREMTGATCEFPGDREETLIAYLYNDIEEAVRTAFDAHLPECARCRGDLTALGGVRAQLARWTPPTYGVISHQSSVTSHQSPVVGRQPSWWRDVPAWAQVAAALVFLGVGAGLANLDVHYDRNGLSVRTGWNSRQSPVASRQSPVAGGQSPVAGGQSPVAGGQSPVAGGQSSVASGPSPIVRSGVAQDSQPGVAQDFSPAGASSANPAPWRADMTALEQHLRTEFRATSASAVSPVNAASSVNPVVLSRVKAIVDESEKREQRELALRIAEVLRDINVQRQADLVKIDRTLGVLQNNTGVEVMKNRQMLNYLVTASQQKPQ